MIRYALPSIVFTHSVKTNNDIYGLPLFVEGLKPIFIGIHKYSNCLQFVGISTLVPVISRVQYTKREENDHFDFY